MNEQLYKVIGGDWGNNYGYVKEVDGNAVKIELLGQGITIDHDLDQLLAVPFFGA